MNFLNVFPQASDRAAGRRLLRQALLISALLASSSSLSGCGHNRDPFDHVLRDSDSQVEARLGVPFVSRDLLAGGSRLFSSGRADGASEAKASGENRELSVQEAIARALRQNRSLQASAIDLAIAETALTQAGLLTNPTIGQSSGFLFPVSPVRGAGSFDLNISAQLNSIFTREARMSVADAARWQAGIDFAKQAIETAMNVRTKYNEVAHLRRAASVADRVAEVYQRASRAAEARAKVGIIAQPEVNRARLQAEDAARQSARLIRQADRAARELNTLMGEGPSFRWTLADPADPAASSDPAGDLKQLPTAEQAENAAPKWRLDIAHAYLDVVSARATVELAKAGLIPPISVGLEGGRASDGSATLGPFFSVGLPIFDTGRTAVRAAELSITKAERTLAALDEQVRTDVATALSNANLAADDLTFYTERQLPQQAENVRLAELAFENGRTDLDSFLNTLRDYVSTLQAREDAVAALADARIALERALGTSVNRILGNTPAPDVPLRATAAPSTSSTSTNPRESHQ